MPLVRLRFAIFAMSVALVSVSIVACSRGSRSNDGTIRITGSDTMVNLAQSWAEAYRANHPDISPQVKGGGSGVGIAALCVGKIDVATASRAMKPKEIELAKKNTGKEPKQFIVGRDALALYINKQNPLESVSLGELAEIYGADGTITRWDELGVQNTSCSDGKVIPVSRQNSSGTYAYFKEAVLGEKREYRQGISAQSGSSDVVALVSKTPCAIGYSGMGYRTDEIKVLKISREKGQPGVEPTLSSALDGSYPISRPLYLYTLGEPSGAVQEFVQWILSDEGQTIVEQGGYVPISMEAAAPH